MFYLFLAWQPPRDEGGRTDITYRVACIFPTHRAAKLVYTPAQDEIHSTFVRVQGVEPNTEYKFRVYSQNGVSKVKDFGYNLSKYMTIYKLFKYNKN